MINAILNPILGPILLLNPLVSIMIVALLMSIIITLAYKLFTNQSLMKDLKSEQKELQKKIKELKAHPEKAMKVQSKMMEINMKYMSHSMKPTLFTFLPIILIFGWLNSHIAYYPLIPDIPFEVKAVFDEGINGDVKLELPDGISFVDSRSSQQIVNTEASWNIKGELGEHELKFSYAGEEQLKNILITEEREYEQPIQKIKKSAFKQIIIGNEKVKPFNFLPIPWIKDWGWLGAYIIFSLIFSMSIRRIMKIY